jgi:hypothetical protein
MSRSEESAQPHHHQPLKKRNTQRQSAHTVSTQTQLKLQAEKKKSVAVSIAWWRGGDPTGRGTKKRSLLQLVFHSFSSRRGLAELGSV